MGKNNQKTKNENQEKNRGIKYIKKSELKQLLTIIDNLRNKLIIKLLFTTFCRSNELKNIKISDIDFDNNEITLRAEVTKIGKKRILVIDEELKNEIKSYLKLTKRNSKDKGYLLTTRQSKQITNARLRQIVNFYAEKAGIQKVYTTAKDGRKLHHITPHSFRHGGIIEAQNKGIPREAIKQQSGHKSDRVFAIYSQFSTEDRKRLFKERGFYDDF